MKKLLSLLCVLALCLGMLPAGKWRMLTPQERSALESALRRGQDMQGKGRM